MANNAIGSASVTLSANADQLSAGLAKAQQAVNKFAAKGQQVAAKSEGGGAGGKGGGILGGLLVGGGIGAGIAVASKAIDLAVGSFGAAMDKVGETAKMGEIAQAFGTTGEKISGVLGIMKAAGSPIKESLESLTQFGTRISEGMNGGSEATQKFFQQLGKSPQAFAQLDATDQFYALFEGIQKIESPLERMNALSMSFGTDGMKLLLPLLNKTSDELREQAKLYAINEAAIAKTKVAQTAFVGLQAAGDRLLTGVVAGLSPAFAAFADSAAAAVQFVTPLVSRVAAAVGDVLGTIGRVAEAISAPIRAAFGRAFGDAGPLLDKLSEGWQAFSFVAVEVGTLVGTLVADLIDGIADIGRTIVEAVQGWLGFSVAGTNATSAVFAGVRKVAEGAGYLWDSLKVGARVVAAEVGAPIIKVYADILRAVQEAVNGAARLAKGIPGLGWVERMGGSLDGVADRIDAMGGKLAEFGKNPLRGFGDSARQAGEWADRLAAKFASVGTRTAAAEKKADEMKPVVPKLAGAFEKGSKEAYSAIVKNQFGGGKPDDIDKRQLKEAQEQTQLLRRTASALERLPTFGVI